MSDAGRERELMDAQSIDLARVARCTCGAWAWVPAGKCFVCGNVIVAIDQRMAG